MSTTGYEATLAAARRLPLAERLRLASALVGEAAGELHPAPVRQPLTPAEAKAAWAQLRESIRDLPTPRLTLGEQLEADRRERDHALLGRHTEANTEFTNASGLKPEI
ncbi:MAG: hypothetical protein WCG26_09440 [Chloroflexales bacterium]